MKFSRSFIRRKSLADDMIICFSRVSLLQQSADEEQKSRTKKKEDWNARAGARTLDIVVKSHTLYRLSYPGDGNTRSEVFDTLVFVSDELKERIFLKNNLFLRHLIAYACQGRSRRHRAKYRPCIMSFISILEHLFSLETV